MNKEMTTVPKITKMAKYLSTLAANREHLTYNHMRILAITREMNTTANIISGLTGIENTKVHARLKELLAWGLVSIVENRTVGNKRVKRFWGMHDDFRAERQVPTYPTALQEGRIAVERKKGGRSLEMDEVAAILWAGPESAVTGRSETLVEIATTLKRTRISAQAAGDAKARKVTAPEPKQEDIDINDYIEDDI